MSWPAKSFAAETTSPSVAAIHVGTFCPARKSSVSAPRFGLGCA
jgi:hypothetical protein